MTDKSWEVVSEVWNIDGALWLRLSRKSSELVWPKPSDTKMALHLFHVIKTRGEVVLWLM